MKHTFFYYFGLVLTIMGLIGIISGIGPYWSRYLVFGVGLVILLISFLKAPKK